MKPLALAPERRERLIEALDQLASEVPEERAAAGLEVTVVLRTVGLPWDRLLVPAAAPVHKPAAPEPIVSDWRADAALCRNRLGYLKAWEQAFLADLNGVDVPTRKQGAVLAEIAAGLRMRGLGEDARSRPPMQLHPLDKSGAG